MQKLYTIGGNSIRLAITPGVPTRQLSALLALQREEEPETDISLHEVDNDTLLAGLREGRYDAGLALMDAEDASLHSQPLWREAMVVAIPLRYPLLDKATLTLDDVAGYPIFRWQAEPCPSLEQQMSSLPEKPCDIQSIASFELLAMWVAAGYGIGMTAQSRTAHARAWGICMRPLVTSSDAPFEIVTYLVWSAKRRHDAHERFARRTFQTVEV